jgi:transcription elongation factor GreB
LAPAADGIGMSKAFVKEGNDAADDDDDVAAPPIPAGSKNYMTPRGYQQLKDELVQLLNVDRPEVVRTVSWAASNGDRSENGDYIYGKKRLREIDRRIRFLTKRLDNAEVVDPAARAQLGQATDQVFFGASVRYANGAGEEVEVAIVGIDEVDLPRGRISWISPVARALTKARVGDSVQLRTPVGVETLDVIDVRYVALD